MQPDWRARAACRGLPVELFITSGDDDDEPYYPSPSVKKLCDGCPVKVECLRYAVDHNVSGTWAGTSTFQRRQLTRERERAKCPSCSARELIYENNVQLCLACGMSWPII